MPEAANSWITTGMLVSRRRSESIILQDKFDDDWEVDQQRKKAQQLYSEEQAKIAGPQPKRKSDRRTVVRKSRDY